MRKFTWVTVVKKILQQIEKRKKINQVVTSVRFFFSPDKHQISECLYH